MAEQTTLILIKPDAVQRGLIGDITSRFERKGLTIVGMRMLIADRATAEKHYAVHSDKPFFGSLVDFITSSPLVALALQGDEAVSVARNSDWRHRRPQSCPRYDSRRLRHQHWRQLGARQRL